MSRKLTAKQALFPGEYIKDFNGTQAAIRCGYKESRAQQTASDLLAKPEIQEAIAQALEARNERTEINADYVLKRLVEIDEMDVADILDDNGGVLPIKEWPKSWCISISGFDVSELYDGFGDEREISGLLKKIKWPDKTKNLELLGKHINVQAFKEKIEHSGSMDVVSRLQRGRERAKH